MNPRTIGLLALAVFAGASPTHTKRPPFAAVPQAAASIITASELKMHASFLASDELGGRYSFSQGNRVAAVYLAAQLDAYGYRGAAPDGSFLQPVPITYGAVDVAHSGLTLATSGTSYPFEYERDYMLESPMVAAIPDEVNGELVFVGYGISSPRNDHDDYAAVDVRGKFVITTNGAPERLANVTLDATERGNPAAEAHGALGLIIISEGLLANYDGFSAGYAQRSYFRIAHGANPATMVFQVVQAGPALVQALAEVLQMSAETLISPSGKALAPAAVPATIRVRTRFTAEQPGLTHNVVGLLEGADPAAKHEYIVLGAHYDHLESAPNGEIYNGADDNASGTSAVLVLAKAFATGARPRRSILVAFYTAEELGLLGSRFLTDHEPLVPLGSVVATFNFDMVGRSGGAGDAAPNDVLTGNDAVFLLGACLLSRELCQISEQANGETVHLRLDHTYRGPRGLVFRRSDHYNFHRHGIPVIWYHTGAPREYHQPTDDVHRLDFQKMERITRLGFATSWRVANLNHRLTLGAPRGAK